MTDPIQCRAPELQSGPIECEPVLVTSSSAAAEKNECSMEDAPEPDPHERATATLVSRATSAPLVPLTRPPTSFGDKLLECSSELLSVATLAVAVRGATPAVAAIVGLKAGLDVGKCLALEVQADRFAEAERPAVDGCLNRGGIPAGFAGDSLVCMKPERE